VVSFFLIHFFCIQTIAQQQKYGLVFNFVKDDYDVDAAIKCAADLLCRENHFTEFKEKGRQLVKDHIDVTQFLFDFIKSKLNR